MLNVCDNIIMPQLFSSAVLAMQLEKKKERTKRGKRPHNVNVSSIETACPSLQ